MKKQPKSFLQTYKKLLILLLLTLVASLTPYLSSYFITSVFNTQSFMLSLMGSLLLVFGGFKLLDVRGFADGFATYDLLAPKLRFYALLYPFIEFSLGVLLISKLYVTESLWVLLVLMTFGSIGVIIALAQKRKISCVCLGTAIDLPLTKVTVIEDLTMAIMALAMIIFM